VIQTVAPETALQSTAPAVRPRFDGALAGAALASLALGAILGGAALGVVDSARVARLPHGTAARLMTAPANAPPVTAATAGTEMPEGEADAPVAAAPSFQPRGARRSAAPARPPGSTESAAYHVAPGRVVGYSDGHTTRFTVTLVDGKPVEVHTAEAFEHMRSAAARAGVHLAIVSGFRTLEHQRALYAAFRRGRGNLAAPPGHSHHQNGRALDLNVGAPGVLHWHDEHAREFGFRRTVPTESWHWEHAAS
jgi:hypothetical protein